MTTYSNIELISIKHLMKTNIT